ncbi:tRNA (adenosine(37)-N6)-threonylcarbamoyltransferase complex transferase subunit TsaD [Rubinisphaera margarita]|uniref:tRNA (adenosine(37)-N6)-threonylcarbamoyltransferase complex transferase subunit TsaD n=1 Tax=Rubinisphaera margarita TaxID=2909586 RepID=UPI001EE8CB25|nr:tRNA (adenosine(37)-N6)-threonylcarbamoyltransferase complex transferase subunit TsaD [Rubinisphaera margarita]MCG6154290.1 tRNA (adenosine(37)-N6)-threonylcarbamoyltransferase complex transferase subunit TsaD [Rubinisphaera margarita]
MAELLLSLESTCDETAAAVIQRDGTVLSSIVSSQTDLHERYGGVVPEVAARAHLERILPVIDRSLQQAGVQLNQLSAVAVATHPGLIGSLLVGVTAAKTLAMTLDVPLIAIDHVTAHIYACQMVSREKIFPAVGLVVSGGHTNLYDCRDALTATLLGSTIDDAAGEAFDKVAAILELPYPGGPSIQKCGEQGNEDAFPFPRSFYDQSRLAFSFSGLKTAVLYEVRGKPGHQNVPPPMTDQRRADIAASFEKAVVEVLVRKCEQALAQTGAKNLCVGGGVAANRRLRIALQKMAGKRRIKLVVAPMEYCTDNAAMGAIAWEKYERGLFAPLNIDPTPGLVRAPM